MSGADLYGGCPGCGVNVDPDIHDCFTPPPIVASRDDVKRLRLREASEQRRLDKTRACEWPTCDRGWGHPGSHMRRCTEVEVCTDPQGHRGRHTVSAYSEWGWRTDAQAPL